MDKEELITRLVKYETRQEYMINSIEELKNTVGDGFKSLNCGQNEAKLNELYIWHTGVKGLIKKAKGASITATISAFIAGIAWLFKEIIT